MKFFLFSCRLSEKKVRFVPRFGFRLFGEERNQKGTGCKSRTVPLLCSSRSPADRKGFTLRSHWPRRRAGKAWPRNKSEDLPDRFDAGNARGLAFRYRMRTSLQLFGPVLRAEDGLAARFCRSGFRVLLRYVRSCRLGGCCVCDNLGLNVFGIKKVRREKFGYVTAIAAEREISVCAAPFFVASRHGDDNSPKYRRK